VATQRELEELHVQEAFVFRWVMSPQARDSVRGRARGSEGTGPIAGEHQTVQPKQQGSEPAMSLLCACPLVPAGGKGSERDTDTPPHPTPTWILWLTGSRAGLGVPAAPQPLERLRERRTNWGPSLRGSWERRE